MPLSPLAHAPIIPIHSAEPHPVVLLIDDDALNRRAIRETLGAHHTLIEADDCASVLAAIDRRPPDLIVLHADLHDGNALAFYRAIRALPQGTRLPILIVGALDDDAVFNAEAADGVCDFVTKPVNTLLLRQRAQLLLHHHRQAQALQRNEQLLQLVQNMVRIGYWDWDLRNRVVQASPTLVELFPFLQPRREGFGWERRAELYVDPKLLTGIEQAVHNREDSRNVEFSFRSGPDNQLQHFMIRARIEYDGDVPARVLCSVQDITRLVVQQTKLRRADRIIEESRDGIAQINGRLQFTAANSAFQNMFGYTLRELRAKEPSSIVRFSAQDTPYAQIQAMVEERGFWRGEVIGLHRSGAQFPLLVSVKRMLDSTGHFDAYVVILTDISLIKDSQRRLYQLAHYDVLTGLANRVSLQEQLEAQLASADPACVLLYIDLDGFKLVNDTVGHATGDALLVEVAQRLQRVMRTGDLLARIGGDEFAVLMRGEPDREVIAAQAQAAFAELHPAFTLEGRDFFIGASIGACCYPEQAGAAGDMLRNADSAMYEAKRRGRSQLCFYSHEMTQESARRLNIENELRVGIELGQLQLLYQPKYDAASLRMIGVEALVRWHSPTRGVVPPAEFIDIAETSGLVVPLGDWVIEEACRQIAQWERKSGASIPVAVNISALHLYQPGLPAVLGDALARHGVRPALLQIEITEDSLDLRQQPELPHAVLNALSGMGLSIAIDDFGTGYSSLSQLKLLPISTLKIDRSFVRDIADDPSDFAIVSAVTALARTLQLQVVAEGVETREQMAQLRLLHCDAFQGYLFARPLPPAEALAQFLAQSFATGN